jgi:DNA polymerase delta subunit 1
MKQKRIANDLKKKRKTNLELYGEEVENILEKELHKEEAENSLPKKKKGVDDYNDVYTYCKKLINKCTMEDIKNDKMDTTDDNVEYDEYPFVDDIRKYKDYWKRGVDKDKCMEDDDVLVFHEVKTDYTTKWSKNFDFYYPGPKNKVVPVIRIFGITQEGKSVLCNVWGFRPYFYLGIPKDMNKENLNDLIEELEKKNKDRMINRLMERYYQNLDKCSTDEEAARLEYTNEISIEKIKDHVNYISDYEIIKKRSVWEYDFNKDNEYIKIYTYVPPNVRILRNLAEEGVTISGKSYKFQTYESNVMFVLRCLADKSIYPSTWIKVKKFEYSMDGQSNCDIEVNVSCNNIKGLECKDEYDKLASYCILSFDIECYGDVCLGTKKKKSIVRMPKAKLEKCRVTQIANTVTINKVILMKNCFTLNSCKKLYGDKGDVYSFEDEEDLLMGWREFVLTVDPDIITGYNIINFDLPYLIKRGKYLKLNDFPLLGRIKNEKCKYRRITKGSKQSGIRKGTDITFNGRNIIDVMNYVKNYGYKKLTSYTLNNVAFSYLGDKKEDVHYSMIPKLQDANSRTRKRLVTYCIKDALLPQKLMNKLNIIESAVEMSRVTGVELEWVVEKGQQIRTFSQLIRHSNKMGYIIPAFSNKKFTDKFEGATVKTPMIGFNENPIGTLDFKSLYPSIMIEHNLCYTTYVRPENIHLLSKDDYIISPSGDCFVKPHIREGFLPFILVNLLSARQKAKDAMKLTEDKERKNVLDGRQLALKISCNSVYGFTGANGGMLPLRCISKSVTSFGRKMIEQTSIWVEKKFKKGELIKWPEDKKFDDEAKRCYKMKYNTKVIYGDTDSVMIDFGPIDRKDAWFLSHLAEYYVDKELFKSEVIKLCFEKIFHPYLLLSKKNYAGLHFEGKTKWLKPDKLNTKGIEVVRRDKPAFVREALKETLEIIFKPYRTYPVKKRRSGVYKAYLYLHGLVRDLIQRKLSFDKFIITTRVSKEVYKTPTPHTELVKKIAIRDPGSEPKLGDRVKYVFVQRGIKCNACEMSEDPIYALKNDIPINIEYYLVKKFIPVIENRFSAVFTVEQLYSIFGGYMKLLSKKTKGERKIMKVPLNAVKFELKKQSKLKIKRPTILSKNKGNIGFYFKKKKKCINCMKNDEKKNGLCKDCLCNKVKIYKKFSEMKNRIIVEYKTIEKECIQCQGEDLEQIPCSNDDCPNFYKKFQIRKDIKKIKKLLSNF